MRNELISPEGKRQVETLLDTLYHRPEGMSDREASKLAMAFIEERFLESSMYVLDYLLETIDFDRVPVHVTSSVLRTTVFASRVLPSWAPALERAKTSLDQQGVNTESLLQGLTTESSDE